VAQVGLWDVDGMGLQKIQDTQLASDILQKVNNFNKKTVLRATAAAFLFAATYFI